MGKNWGSKEKVWNIIYFFLEEDVLLNKKVMPVLIFLEIGCKSLNEKKYAYNNF